MHRFGSSRIFRGLAQGGWWIFANLIAELRGADLVDPLAPEVVPVADSLDGRGGLEHQLPSLESRVRAGLAQIADT